MYRSVRIAITAPWLTKTKFDRSVIMKLTGYKTLAMFTRYNTIDRDDARLAMELLGGFLEGEKCSHSVPEGVEIKKQGLRPS